MTDPLQIRSVGQGDREAISAIAQQVIEEGTSYPQTSVEDLLAYWFGPSCRAFVALLQGQVVGSYVIKPNQPGRGAHVANAGYIVDRSHRGRGIGRALGEHSLATAKDMGFRAMQYNLVVSTNKGAIALWERLGFRIVGTLSRAFEHPSLGPVDAHVMFRSLDDVS